MSAINTGYADWVRGIYATLAARGVAVPAAYAGPAGAVDTSRKGRQPAAEEMRMSTTAKMRISGSLDDWMPDWRGHRPDCPTLQRLRAAGLSCVAPEPAPITAPPPPPDSPEARVRRAMTATKPYLPPADNTPPPAAPFIGRASGDTAPPPIDMAARIAKAKGGR